MSWRPEASSSRTMRCGRSCVAKGSASRKTLFALEQARADVAHQRRHWHVLQAGLDPRRLVFIDETWIKTNMAPLRGWPAKGQRLRGFAPHGRWQTLTFLGAFRRDRITAPCIFDGPINGQCRYSGPSAQDFGACRPIRPISTRSKRPSPRSNTGCASPGNAHPKPSRARHHPGREVAAVSDSIFSVESQLPAGRKSNLRQLPSIVPALAMHTAPQPAGRPKAARWSGSRRRGSPAGAAPSFSHLLDNLVTVPGVRHDGLCSRLSTTRLYGLRGGAHLAGDGDEYPARD
jgi:hypothetical protein